MKFREHRTFLYHSKGKTVIIVLGEILSLNRLSQQQDTSETLTQEQAQIAANIILDILDFKKATRENLRAEQEGITPVSTSEIEKRILEGFSKIEDLGLKKLSEKK